MLQTRPSTNASSSAFAGLALQTPTQSTGTRAVNSKGGSGGKAGKKVTRAMPKQAAIIRERMENPEAEDISVVPQV
jgi:hypothetical protein